MRKYVDFPRCSIDTYRSEKPYRLHRDNLEHGTVYMMYMTLGSRCVWLASRQAVQIPVEVHQVEVDDQNHNLCVVKLSLWEPDPSRLEENNDTKGLRCTIDNGLWKPTYESTIQEVEVTDQKTRQPVFEGFLRPYLTQVSRNLTSDRR